MAALRTLVEASAGATSATEVRCVFNPGRRIPKLWFRSLPDAVFVTFEGPADRHGLADPTGPLDRQCHLVHGAVDPHAVELPEGIAFAYVTADEAPNPWDVFDATT